MNQRYRLVDLKREAMNHAQEKSDERNGLVCIDDEVDYLLDNGVIVPPCKIGDPVYKIIFTKRRIPSHITRNLCWLSYNRCSGFKRT